MSSQPNAKGFVVIEPPAGSRLESNIECKSVNNTYLNIIKLLFLGWHPLLPILLQSPHYLSIP